LHAPYRAKNFERKIILILNQKINSQCDDFNKFPRLTISGKRVSLSRIRSCYVALGAINGVRDVALRFRSNGSRLPTAVTALSVAVFLLVGRPAPVMAQHMMLPGKASVDPNGNASYTIPISVPPGTAGQAPSLSFQYNNQSGNGLLGMGWSLGG
jgi:hypothetical protein